MRMMLCVLSALLISGTEALSLTVALAEPASERQAVDISSLLLPAFLLAFLAQLAIILVTSEDGGNTMYTEYTYTIHR